MTDKLDPKPWLFISDQVFGEHRSDHDKGYHDVSGTYWAFHPRLGYEQDRAKYEEHLERMKQMATIHIEIDTTDPEVIEAYKEAFKAVCDLNNIQSLIYTTEP